MNVAPAIMSNASSAQVLAVPPSADTLFGLVVATAMAAAPNAAPERRIAVFAAPMTPVPDLVQLIVSPSIVLASTPSVASTDDYPLRAPVIDRAPAFGQIIPAAPDPNRAVVPPVDDPAGPKGAIQSVLEPKIPKEQASIDSGPARSAVATLEAPSTKVVVRPAASGRTTPERPAASTRVGPPREAQAGSIARAVATEARPAPSIESRLTPVAGHVPEASLAALRPAVVLASAADVPHSVEAGGAIEAVEVRPVDQRPRAPTSSGLDDLEDRTARRSANAPVPARRAQVRGVTPPPVTIEPAVPPSKTIAVFAVADPLDTVFAAASMRRPIAEGGDADHDGIDAEPAVATLDPVAPLPFQTFGETPAAVFQADEATGGRTSPMTSPPLGQVEAVQRPDMASLARPDDALASVANDLAPYPGRLGTAPDPSGRLTPGTISREDLIDQPIGATSGKMPPAAIEPTNRLSNGTNTEALPLLGAVAPAQGPDIAHPADAFPVAPAMALAPIERGTPGKTLRADSADGPIGATSGAVRPEPRKAASVRRSSEARDDAFATIFRSPASAEAAAAPSPRTAAAADRSPSPGASMHRIAKVPEVEAGTVLAPGPASVVPTPGSPPGQAAAPIDAAALTSPGNTPAPALDQLVGVSPAARPTGPAAHVVAAERLPVGRLGRDLGVAIARHLSAGGGELRVRLDPAELGRIDVRMSFNDQGTLRAVVGTDSGIVLDMLRRDSPDLGRAMADAGVRADGQSFRFEGNGGDPRSAGDGQFRGQRQPPGRARDGREPDAPDEFRPFRWRGSLDVTA